MWWYNTFLILVLCVGPCPYPSVIYLFIYFFCEDRIHMAYPNNHKTTELGDKGL